MKTDKKQIEVFIADDGKEFLTEKECKDYETNVLTKLDNIQYFKYCTGLDLTETGMFYSHNYAAVYLPGWSNCYKDVLLQYLIDKHNGKVISEGVQGYGVTSLFSIHEIDKDQYFQKRPNTWGGSTCNVEQIFISEEPIDGYPENIKVISKHINLK